MKYTDQDELRIYRKFMHRMQLFSVACNEAKVVEGVHLIFDWSRAHRVGNGELTDEEVQSIVEGVIQKMEEY